MMRYENEFLVRERMRERLQDAERERLARAATAGRRGRSWPSRLPNAIVRRLVRVAGAA